MSQTAFSHRHSGGHGADIAIRQAQSACLRAAWASTPIIPVGLPLPWITNKGRLRGYAMSLALAIAWPMSIGCDKRWTPGRLANSPRQTVQCAAAACGIRTEIASHSKRRAVAGHRIDGRLI